MKKRYEAVYSGDTGFDHGGFTAGRFDTFDEAAQAARKGAESCFNWLYGYGVIDHFENTFTDLTNEWKGEITVTDIPPTQP